MNKLCLSVMCLQQVLGSMHLGNNRGRYCSYHRCRTYRICTLLCVMLKKPKRIIICEKSPERIRFVREHYPDVLVTEPENCKDFVLKNSDHGGADVVLEVAGSDDSFHLAWDCARPNAIVTIVALYDKPQLLSLPDMYGKNLVLKQVEWMAAIVTRFSC